METPAQQCARLLVALEDLLAQESHLIGAKNYEELKSILERAAPVIERLVELAPMATAAARDRAQTLIALRHENLERIASHVSQVEEQLDQSRKARSQLTHLAPVYRTSPPSTVRRLRAQG